MRWSYDDEYRDEFGKGVHRDILIVPHATNVTKVKGGPPDITSKIPVFAANGQPTNEFQDVEWVITNDDIVKEKFKYSYSLNPNDNITFSSASSAMVQFTIRNKKEYNPDTNRWELDIPNLQYYSFVDENNNVIMGELEGNYIIKVYEYFNGDSDTLIYLGMFRVEEDKAVDNGYNRQITAYDFMMTFREMDIFNWYKHLFTGINKLDNDYVDATNKSGKETTKPDNYDDDVNWVRKPAAKLFPNGGHWTIGAALQDLIDNLAAYDMIVYDESGNAMVGMTNTNPTLYGRDYGEGVGYSGLGMPIMLDPELFDETAEYSIPTEPGEDQFEHYGYMKISELEFMEDPSIMKSESLSMGKFLEDIGVLAGRYPYIRTDYLEDDDYHDPSSYAKGKNRYNNYERCILTFKPLPSSKDDKTSSGITKLQPEQTFSNHEIVKGFQHELFTVKDVMIVKIYFRDGNELEFKKLTKNQRADDKKKALQTFTFSDNMFCSYLVDESDDEEIKKLIPEYQKIKDKLFGKQKKNGNLKGDALFYPGYLNIKYRNYVPYKLQTFCDPVRDVGDRIQINFEDKVTGELSSFYTYILSRDIEGIQKQMDTYSANGQQSNPIFSNYQTSSRYESSIGNNIQLLGYKKLSDAKSGGGTLLAGYVTPSDLVGYLRNVGVRLLDEPLVASAKFMGKSMSSYIDSSCYYVKTDDYEYYDEDTGEWVTSWDGIIPSKGETSTHGLYWYNDQGIVTGVDMPWSKWPTGYNQIASDQPFEVFNVYTHTWNEEDSGLSYVYDLNGKWVEHRAHKPLHASQYPYVIKPYNLVPGDNTNIININGIDVTLSGGELLYYDYDDISGLDNFVYYDENRTIRRAYYLYPDCVWTDDQEVAEESAYDNDYAWKCLTQNGEDSYDYVYDSTVGVPRIVIRPLISNYNYCWFDENEEIDQTTKQVTINGKYKLTANYGMCLDFNNDNGLPYGDIGALQNTGSEAAYCIPGAWLDDTSGGDITWMTPGEYDIKISINAKANVELKWQDPGDITDYEPTPATWKGTIVIRKEDSAPKHRWDGVEIVRTTTSNKDAYKETAYKDEDIELGKVYYYGFFPYYKAREQDGHNINFFRYTKVIKVETGVNDISPVITDINVNGNSITISYSIPKNQNGYDSIKLYGKIDETPKCNNTDDVIEDVDASLTSITINSLNYESEYYFCIQTVSTDNLKLTSNVINAKTDDYTSYDFDFTGSEQTFTVPETGLYRFETWGAQGQDDGSTRGGYGSYSVGEMQLTAGQTLYINVGGQNGYNGGGNYSSGNIRNIIMPNFNQTIVFDGSLWTNDWSSGKITPGSLPLTMKLGTDFLDSVMNATLGTESILLYENNGVQVLGMRDSTNATYGGYYKYSVYIKDNGTIVAGSMYPTAYYSQAWYLASGFDKRIGYYNSNVRSQIHALYIGFGVDDDAQLGYMVGCAKYHNGYYENTDTFTSKKISNNTGQYGVYCNSAKLYDALKKMAGEI